jgi:endonuclease/exonuclease/phosphatase family metal-dependent hydrolase
MNVQYHFLKLLFVGILSFFCVSQTASANDLFDIKTIALTQNEDTKPKPKAKNEVEALRILTWNIQMLPRWAVKRGQKTRAKWIIDTLLQQNVDVIVFEEVFDIGIRGRLRLALLTKYPFQVGVQNKKWTWRQSNGVWIVSRVPIKHLKHIFFKSSYGTDGLANKGAVMIEGNKKGKKFQIVATHLQSMQEPGAALVRDEQFKQIRAELLDKYAKEGVPQMLIGDLNTPRHVEAEYKNMLNVVGMCDTELCDERPFTWDKTNSWNTEYEEEPNSQLDYILINTQRSLAKIKNLSIYRPTKLLENKKVDLADHYGVIGDIILE